MQDHLLLGGLLASLIVAAFIGRLLWYESLVLLGEVERHADRLRCEGCALAMRYAPSHQHPKVRPVHAVPGELADNSSVIDHQDSIAQIEGFVEVERQQKHSPALVPLSDDLRVNELDSAYVQSPGRLDRQQNRRLPKELAPQTPEDRFAAAIREGRVVEGMSAAQVREALGSRPTSVVREASRSKVTEMWIYQTQGLVVELTKSATSAEPVVRSVSSIADRN